MKFFTVNANPPTLPDVPPVVVEPLKLPCQADQLQAKTFPPGYDRTQPLAPQSSSVYPHLTEATASSTSTTSANYSQSTTVLDEKVPILAVDEKPTVTTTQEPSAKTEKKEKKHEHHKHKHSEEE